MKNILNKKRSYGFRQNFLLNFLLVFFLLLGSCAQVTSLNLQKHEFGKLPTKIVWLQVAGLSEEHLALLKFSYPSSDINTSFEKALCVGKAWEYDLFRIRPDAASGFMSQMTGKKNIKNSCEDYKLRPAWSYVLAKGYKAGVFEGESSPKESLLEAKSCGHEEFLAGLKMWKMEAKPPKEAAFFHVDENTEFRAGQVYYDRSCLSGDCFSTLSSNVEKTFQSFSKNTNNFLYIVRNFKYAKYLQMGKTAKAKEELNQLNKIMDYFQGLAEKRSDFLLLVTTAGAKHSEFPVEGKSWANYEKKGTGFSAKRSNLMSTVFVNGARAENFCGVYEQSEVMSRIFSGAKQQGLELTIINPFKD